MSKVALVTLDDMPPLALGEFQLSDDFETLFAGVGDVAEGGTGGGGGTPSGKPSVPSGTSPSQIKTGVFKRLAVYNYSFGTGVSPRVLGANFNRVIVTISSNIDTAPQSASINLTREV